MIRTRLNVAAGLIRDMVKMEAGTEVFCHKQKPKKTNKSFFDL
ncbi:MAG: hypothetical protein UH078_04330 [Macrococcus canis]|nr:hypothetical protein [Macrococcus canis]MEE1107189.1 hypothetical protein [Macrococcus canis]